MLFYMGTVSFDVVPVIRHRDAPGSMYRSPQVYAKLRTEMDSDNSTADAINIEVKVAAGTPTRKVIVQELVQSNATWLVLDRHLRRDSKYYLEQIPCKIAFFHKDLSLEVVRSYNNERSDNNIDHELLFSMSKSVDTVINGSSVSTGSTPSSDNNQELSGKEDPTSLRSSTILNHSPNKSPPLCCDIKTEQHIKNSMSFKYSEIQSATDDFSKANMIGEGGYGLVYKGKRKSNGQLIAAKVRK